MRICLFILFVMPLLAFSQTQLPGPAVIAHRGGAKLAPENTLSAVTAGLEYQVEYLEIDIHQTLDSVLVVHHDETVNRCSNGSGRIDQLTYEQLGQLDGGSWFGEEYAGEQIPRLEEVMDLVAGQCGLWIEVKGGKADYPGLEKRLVRMIRERNAYNWCQVISFDGKALGRIHELDPNIRLQKLLVAPLRGLPLYLDKGLRWGSLKRKYDWVAGFDLYHKTARKSLIRTIHKWGKEFNVWTINDPERIRQLSEKGVDGITTDDPSLLREKK